MGSHKNCSTTKIDSKMRLFILSLAFLAIAAETQENPSNAVESSVSKERARRLWDTLKKVFWGESKKPCTYTKYTNAYLSGADWGHFATLEDAQADCTKE